MVGQPSVLTLQKAIPSMVAPGAEVAQSVEHRTENAGVPSSSLGLSTTFSNLKAAKTRKR